MPADSIHFRILEDIALDLSGDVNFPTCLDAAILIRNVLRDPEASLEQVVQAVSVEPLISSKLLRLANSASYNPAGHRISDLGKVVARLGFEIVRTTSLAVAMDQMLKSRHLSAYDSLARQTWEHSLLVAAVARVLARHLEHPHPDEAMMAGLVHHLGAFYLLYRAAEYSEYRGNESAMVELLAGWHDSIGESLLYILGLPETVTRAVRDQYESRIVESACTVSDILYLAKALANNPPSWQSARCPDENGTLLDTDSTRFAAVLDQARDDIAGLRAALSA